MAVVLRMMIAVAIWAGVCQAATAQSIDTTPAWNGSDFYQRFGRPSGTHTQTYGQTITVGDQSHHLYGFGFRLSIADGGSIIMRGLVYAWDEASSRAVGPALFQSGPVTVSASDYTPYQFNLATPLPVVPGQRLVIFVTVLMDAQPGGTAYAAAMYDSVYPGGQFVYMATFDDAVHWTTEAWTVDTPNSDLVFTAVFAAPAPAPVTTAIPTVSQWGLAGMSMLLALIGLAAMKRKA